MNIDEVKNRYEADEEGFSNYLKFLNENKLAKTYKGYSEKHHIYPRALFPELEKDKNNLVILTGKNHLKAHLLLYKAFKHNSAIIFSFNMMLNRGKYDPNFELENIEKYFERYAEDYEEFRKNVSQIISECNSGRKRTQEQIENIRNNFKNKVVVKDKDGNTFQTDINDPKYVSGEYVYYRVGYRHTDETKKKMSENGIKGLHSYYDENGKVIYRDECPDGYIQGLPQSMKDKLSETNKGRTYLTNPTTGETIRYSENEPYPEGFVKLRSKKGKFVGFDKINESVRCYDIRNGFYGMINKNDVELDYHFLNPQKKSIIIKYDNYYFQNIDNLNDYLARTLQIKIPQCVGNCNEELYRNYDNYIINIKFVRHGLNQMLKDNNGKYLKDVLHLTFCKLFDIIDNDNKIYHNEKMREKYGKRV